MATLRYLATGELQLCNADDLKISQPSVIRAINFPLDIQQLHRIKANFMAIAGMYGSIYVAKFKWQCNLELHYAFDNSLCNFIM